MNKKAIVNFEVTLFDDYSFIHFVLSEVLSPEDLNNMNIPDIVGQNRAHLGVIISGKGPIWLYAYLTHHYHPCAWVAVYDPRITGAVITQCHSRNYNTGDIIYVKLK